MRKLVRFIILCAVSVTAGCINNPWESRSAGETKVVTEEKDKTLLETNTRFYEHSVYMEEIHPSVYLYGDCNDTIDFISSDGRLLKLSNNIKKRDYKKFSLLQKVTMKDREDRFQVILWDKRRLTVIGVGFILASVKLYIHFYLYPYTECYEYRIFESPDYSSPYLSITEECFIHAWVTDVSGRWLKTEFKFGDRNISGWIPPEMQRYEPFVPTI